MDAAGNRVATSATANAAINASTELLAGAERACPIDKRAFVEARVRPSVVAFVLADGAARDTFAATARVLAIVSNDAGAPPSRFALSVRASLVHKPAPPADRRYVVPVPVPDSWIASNVVVDACAAKPFPTGFLGMLWELVADGA